MRKRDASPASLAQAMGLIIEMGISAVWGSREGPATEGTCRPALESSMLATGPSARPGCGSRICLRHSAYARLVSGSALQLVLELLELRAAAHVLEQVRRGELGSHVCSP